MKYFFIDFESISSKNSNIIENLSGIENLKENNEIKFYYKENQKISFAAHKLIMDSKAKIKYLGLDEDIVSGNRITAANAIAIRIMMDICSAALAKGENNFYIISDNNIFDKFIENKKAKSVAIARFGLLSEAIKPIDNKSEESKFNEVKPSETHATPPTALQSVAENKTAPKASVQTTAKAATADKSNSKVTSKASKTYKTLMDKAGFIKFFDKNLSDYKAKKDEIIKAYVSSNSPSDFHNNLMKIFRDGKKVKSVYDKALKNYDDKLFGESNNTASKTLTQPATPTQG